MEYVIREVQATKLGISVLESEKFGSLADLLKGISPEMIDQSIKNAFLRLDNDLIGLASEAILGATTLNGAMSDLSCAYAGSCALLAIYEAATQLLRVACVGDSRAVLGRRNAAGRWETIPLTIDQTGFNVDEAARLKAEHPNEPNLITDGRVLGMAVTRAFGDISCTSGSLTDVKIRTDSN